MKIAAADCIKALIAQLAEKDKQLAAAVAAEHRMAKFIILHGLADTYLCDDMRTDFKTAYCTENPHDDSCIRCIIQHFGRGPQEAGEGGK